MKSFTVFLITNVLSFSLFAQAQQVEFVENKLPLFLGKKLEILSVQGKTLDLKQVLSSKWSQKFQISTQSVPFFGFNQSGWARFFLQNSSDKIKKAYVEQHYIHTDEIILYQKNETGKFEGLALGDKQPSSNQVKPYRFPLFPILVRPGINTYYIRSTSRESTTLPLILKSSTQVQRDSQLPWVLLSLFILFLSMIFLGYLYLKFKSVDTLFYALFCFGAILNHISIEGLLGLYWPQSDWSVVMNEGHFLFALFYRFFLTLGAMQFLGWWKLHRGLRFLFILALSFCALLFVSFFILDYVDLVKPYFVSAFFILVLFVISLTYQIRKGYKPAILYSLSWGYGIIVFLSYTYNFSTNNYSHSIGFLVSTAIHLLFMNVWLYKLTEKNTRYWK